MNRLLPRAALVVLLLLAAGRAQAGDVTLFAAWPEPSENWSHGFGAALSSTWFKVLLFEVEAARTPGADPAVNMTAFTGSACLGPTVGIFTPYGGLGIGVYRESAGTLSDTGVLHALVLGAKMKIGPLFVIKGEYRKLSLGSAPLLAMTHRYSVGAGISF